MKQTTNYQLPQWEETDRIMMKDFNGAMEKIDQGIHQAALGNCRIVTGTYTGTGEYGQERPNTLTFPEEPLLVIIHGDSGFYAMPRADRTVVLNGRLSSYATLPLTWGDKSLSWFSGSRADDQLNTEGVTYHYIILLAA